MVATGARPHSGAAEYPAEVDAWRNESMKTDPAKTRGNDKGSWFPGWFKLFALALAVLIVLKLMQLEVFIEVTYDGVPYLAGLTDIEIFLVPLLLVLIYILWSWLRQKLFGRRGG